ncbi:MAG: hypothetical protein GY845_02320 [Planctomycetes bacterium]|nr:hypothetical protein [Planctomycetota bacterium]
MTEPLSKAELLKQKRAYWKQHIESWRSSGMTQSAYCRHHELKSHQFVYWKKRFVQTDSGITFVPVKIRRSSSSPSDINPSSIGLVMGGDLKIEVMPDFDPRFLRRLITTLRSLP